MRNSDDVNPTAEITDDVRQQCEAWLERRDWFLNMKSKAREDGVHFNLRHDIYDPARLAEPIRSMAMRALGYREEIIVGGAGTRRTFSDFARMHTPRDQLDSLPIDFNAS